MVTMANQLITPFQNPFQQIPYKNDSNSLDVLDSPEGNSSTSNHFLTVPMDSMKIEQNRLDSFKHPNWKCFMDTKKLANGGFYYFGVNDHVRCAFCKVEIGKWEPGDNCEVDHQKYGPMCPFLRGFECGNVPIEPNSRPMRPRSQDVCGRYGIEVRPNSAPEDFGHKIEVTPKPGEKNVNLKEIGVNPHHGPLHKHYCTEESRIATFKEWPRMMKQKPKELAEAGFFYTGRSDQTACFHCGLGLKDWEEHDDPWEQHARWYSRCTHVLLNKGHEFVQEVISRQPPILNREQALELLADTSRPSPSTSSERTSESSACSVASSVEPQPEQEQKPSVFVSESVAEENSKPPAGEDGCLCQICYQERWNVLFLPCKHALACKKCAPLLSTCPLCRQAITATLRIFPSCNHDHRGTS